MAHEWRCPEGRVEREKRNTNTNTSKRHEARAFPPFPAFRAPRTALRGGTARVEYMFKYILERTTNTEHIPRGTLEKKAVSALRDWSADAIAIARTSGLAGRSDGAVQRQAVAAPPNGAGGRHGGRASTETRCDHRSISPKTTSRVPMMVTTSASMWPLDIFSRPARCAKPGGRMWQRYGRLVPSETM